MLFTLERNGPFKNCSLKCFFFYKASLHKNKCAVCL